MNSLSSSKAISSSNSSSKKTINDFRGMFVKMIDKTARSLSAAEHEQKEGAKGSSPSKLVESKTFSNGLDTSSFTVCARVRPMLPHEEESDDFVACVGNTETVTICTPKVNFRGMPKLEKKSFDFDHVFGADSTNEQLAEIAMKPLVTRALNGQVGVMFAYGQTGSGKTHSMNGMMDHLLQSSSLFNESTSLSFSYFEILGTYLNDCLGPNDSSQASDEHSRVAIGETMDGRIVVRNISSHVVQSSEELSTLVEKAKSLRSTAATEKNATSSRSHGIGIITCKDKETGIEGFLYVIDLAGSERSADTKEHDKERMNETKAINASLSTLKDCIRARTLASQIGMGGNTHVPYRRSKLTLLMKDVFDAGCTRLCSTVVLATCSPLAADVSHSANTFKYSSLLCDGSIRTRNGSAGSVVKKGKMQVDASDPSLWSNAQVVEWLTRTYPSLVDPSMFVEGLSGVQLCALPEKDYYSRMEKAGADAGADSTKVAKDIYLAVWTLISDAKTRKRRKDGSIVTEEDEKNERLKMAAATEEKARVWAEREKHLSRREGVES